MPVYRGCVARTHVWDEKFFHKLSIVDSMLNNESQMLNNVCPDTFTFRDTVIVK